MIITPGQGKGVPINEARVTYLNVDLLHRQNLNITYEIGTKVKTLNIGLHTAIDLGFIDFNKLNQIIK